MQGVPQRQDTATRRELARYHVPVQHGSIVQRNRVIEG